MGLVGGASPALASAAGRYLAEAGATQGVVLNRLRREHGVVWGTKKLREVAARLAEAMRPLCRTLQADKVLAWLKQALDGKGNQRPVLSVGRDGITLGMQPGDTFEVATSATMTVYNRQGKRLGTVYLAQPPELGQQTMSDELTALITEVLSRWDGPTPRLCYVTDAGDNETAYYRQVSGRCRTHGPASGWNGSGWSITTTPACESPSWPRPCWSDSGRGKLGSADAETAVEAQRPVACARGRGAAEQARNRQESAARLQPGLRVSSAANHTHAVL